MIIYHNPRCKKSRETLQLIEASGITPTIVKYLEHPPEAHELKRILSLLGKQPIEIIRKNEKIFTEQFKGAELSDEEWIAAMVKYPKLIQRPIVITADKAIIGRPPEAILELIAD